MFPYRESNPVLRVRTRYLTNGQYGIYASRGDRTLDLRLIRPTLYQLSYRSRCL